MQYFERFQNLTDSEMIFIVIIVSMAFGTLFAIVKLIFKSIIIARHGYPPMHCDTFGDDRNKDLEIED